MVEAELHHALPWSIFLFHPIYSSLSRKIFMGEDVFAGDPSQIDCGHIEVVVIDNTDAV